jgi:tetratricopeptide (TPR) repeat protein
MKLAKIPVTGASEGDMLEIVEERGLVYQQVGDYRRAKKDFEKALELASSLGNREKVGRALKNLSSIYIYRRQFEEAYECSLKTLRHAMGTDDTGLEADSLAAFGNIYLFSGRYDRALKFYHEALERDRKNHDRMRASKITMNLGVIHWYKEEYTLAQSYYQLSLEMLRESGDRTFQPLCLNNIALICLQRGLFSRALALCQEALTLSKETGNTTIEAYSYNHISEIYQRIGAYSRALEWIRKAVGLIARVKDRGSKADFLRNRGVAHFLSGDHDKAREDLTKALAVARGSGKREYEMNTLYWLVALLVARGERSEARKYLAEFEEIRDSRDAHEYRMKYAIAASLLHLSGGKPREALGCLDALCLTGAEVNPHLRMIYHLQRALALRASGREGDAKSEAHAAWKITLSLAKKIGDKSLRAGFLKSADAMRIREIIGAAPPLS